MLTLFQKSLLATIALGVLLVAFVIAAKAPAQATTIAPAVQVPLLDAKAAQASAREQAIQDARAKAIAMARTAGVQLGKVTSVSDLASSPSFDAFKAMIPAPGPLGPSAAAQLPTGQLDVVV